MQIISVDFKNIDLLKEALTHRSYVNENRGLNLEHNERLEFLGDAVLELIVTEYLFLSHTQFKEGELTSFRAALVKTESLSEEATRLKFGEFIFMSRGEESTGGRTRPYILANTMEAIIGAIYMDQGYESAKNFIIREICYKTDRIIAERLDIDAKSRLQELAQDEVKITPSYVLVGAEGPDHSKTFEMAVFLEKFEFGKGKGKSKQEAEQNAAAEAIRNWSELFKTHFSKDLS